MNKEEFLKNYTFVTYKEVNEQENYGMSHFVLIMDSLGNLMPFKYTKTKEGGMYYAAPSFSYKENGKSEFVNLIDSTSKKMWLLDFVKENVQRVQGAKTTRVTTQEQSLGLIDPQQKGAPGEEQVPF